jgi:predicted O-methyltransferase YrrM
MYRLLQFLSYYRRALTVYQLHSPFVYALVQAVLEDRRRYYAFTAIERLRAATVALRETIDMRDWGTGGGPRPGGLRRVAIGRLARRAASSPAQGRWLFRLVQWLDAGRRLELGASLGFGTAYLAAPHSRGHVIALEGDAACAARARENLRRLGLPHAEVRAGRFEEALGGALNDLGGVDLVLFDGDHRGAATRAYFEQCLPYGHARTAYVFDDVYASPDMTAAWRAVQHHPAVTLTVDWFDLAVAFANPDLREKQHFRVAPLRWKPWKVF